MVALRILVPPVRVRVLPGQLKKAFNESWTFFFYTRSHAPSTVDFPNDFLFFSHRLHYLCIR